ncbi:MAG: purine-nucleoside phosphorylase [Elusimicrobia bacterium]|nr:purine-nucleoside phosphorylase [Elusimicrobiota bacterium]
MNTTDKINYLNRVNEAAAFLKPRLAGKVPEIGIILGSGLSGAVPLLENAAAVSYADIPGFPEPTVSGHAGRLVVGERGPLGAAIMQGRFHYYEGHPLDAITLPVRVLRELGVKTLILSAAVGSLRPRIKPGHLVFINDHMNFMGANPLKGFHTKEFGEMFPDLAGAYTPALRKTALALCRKLKIPAWEGVYTAVAGPSYETPSEIRAFAKLGGHVVGMSVVPEAIVARQIGLRILAFGWISNMAAGLAKENIEHGDVLALGERMAATIRRFLEAMLDRLQKTP